MPLYLDSNGNTLESPDTAYGRSLVAANNAAAARSVLGLGGAVNTASRGRGVEHFQNTVGLTASTPLMGNLPFYWNNASGTVAQNTAQIPGTLGVITLGTGTIATGIGAILARQAASGTSTLIALGESDTYIYQCRFRIPTLSDASQAFVFRVGFADQFSSTIADGVYLTVPGPGGGVAGACRANNVQTTGATFFTIAASVWYDTEIVMSASACTFNIGGQSQVITTNIPRAINSRRVGYGAVIQKSVGTVARTADIDYIALEWNLAAPA